MNKLKRIADNPYILFGYLNKFIDFRFLPDKVFLKLKYRASFNEKLNLNNPTTYNQKLQWLKLHDRNPLYVKLVDKYEVRNYVKNVIGEKYLIPLIKLYSTYEEFETMKISDFPDQFVIKCTHDSGSVIICKDKNNFDFENAKLKIKKSLKKNYYYKCREWPYKNVPPRIVIEQYLKDADSQHGLLDYKIFCFNGEPKFLYVASDRYKDLENVKFDYFDTNFEKINVRQSIHYNSNYIIEKPTCFNKLLDLSRKLSSNIPQVRLDFYIINNQIYFGEFTFFNQGGFAPFIPKQYDRLFGNYIDLSRFKEKIS